MLAVLRRTGQGSNSSVVTVAVSQWKTVDTRAAGLDTGT